MTISRHVLVQSKKRWVNLIKNNLHYAKKGELCRKQHSYSQSSMLSRFYSCVKFIKINKVFDEKAQGSFINLSLPQNPLFLCFSIDFLAFTLATLLVGVCDVKGKLIGAYVRYLFPINERLLQLYTTQADFFIPFA